MSDPKRSWLKVARTDSTEIHLSQKNPSNPWIPMLCEIVKVMANHTRKIRHE